MAQVCAACDQSQAGLCGQRLKTFPRLLKPLHFRLTGTFSDIEPVDEQRIVDVCGIVGAIATTIPHQRVKAVNTSRQKSDAPAPAGWYPTVPAGRSLDRRHREWHSAPTRPPSMSRVDALYQHRTGLTLNSHPGFAVHCSQRKAGCQECV